MGYLYSEETLHLDVISNITNTKRNNLVIQMDLQHDKQHILGCRGRYKNTDLN